MPMGLIFQRDTQPLTITPSSCPQLSALPFSKLSTNVTFTHSVSAFIAHDSPTRQILWLLSNLRHQQENRETAKQSSASTGCYRWGQWPQQHGLSNAFKLIFVINAMFENKLTFILFLFLYFHVFCSVYTFFNFGIYYCTMRSQTTAEMQTVAVACVQSKHGI